MKTIELKEIPILETGFIGTWFKDRENPEFKKMFSDKTKAFRIQPFYGKMDWKKREDVGVIKLRPIFCDLLEVLKKFFNCEIAIRIDGPVWPNHILKVYQYITEEDAEHRFHIFDAAYLKKGPGYIHSEIAMEYISKYVRSMIADKEIEFDHMMGIAGFFVSDELVGKYLTTDYFNNEAVLKAIEESSAIFCTFSHFEGINMITDKLEFEGLVNCLRTSFKVKIL